MASINVQPRFRRLQTIEPDYCSSKITQYESGRTGLRIVVVDQQGPGLFGYFVLATEIDDDSGAPHTLEHLCFMGSKSYKYKGFLDKVATRAYSATNAWTGTDHTAYTLETAGWAGFAQVLPVYLEHVILPTLTDAGCTTEVHHIDGTGNDAGVVYSEMQGVQNTASELIELRAKRLLYPEGVGFRYETGGMMDQLRVLTAERIRQFHHDLYQPQNLCLAIFGEVDHDQLLDIMDSFESSILSDLPSPNTPFSRPWIESKPAPPLKTSTIERVEFPEEDESFGEIDVRFLGPDFADVISTGALNVALLYLAGSSAAPLGNALVEKEHLATAVHYTLNRRPRTEIAFTLSSVATGRLEEVEKRFFEILRDAMEKPLDMKVMKDCIDRQLRTSKYSAESSPTSFAGFIIADYLFGNRDGTTLQNLQSLKQYGAVLESWSEDSWKRFIQSYISDAPHVSILGVPSARLSETLKVDEAKRLEEQKERLGPDGLREMQAKLDAAKAENDRPIPPELLCSFEVPSTETIHFVSTSPTRSGLALKIGKPDSRHQKVVDDDAKDLPLFLNFQHIPSNFARVELMVSTENLPDELRPLLSVYMESFFGLPLRRGKDIIRFEDVILELERDTVSYAIDLAIKLGNVEGLHISFHVEIEKYNVAIRWLSEFLYHAVFDEERLKAINTRLLADVPDAKRSGDGMLTAVHFMTHLARKSIRRARSPLVKALYLKCIKRLLETDPDEVVRRLEQLRGFLCKFENFRILVVSDLDKLERPASSWASFMEGLKATEELAPIGRQIERLSEAGKNTDGLVYVVPLPTIDSSFAYAIARGPTAYEDLQTPPMMVAVAYLNAVEGPLWAAVRGTGLAYGISVSHDIESGFVILHVSRSPDSYKAFHASGNVVRAHITGEIEFDPLMLDGAISSIVVKFADEQPTPASAAVSNFIQTVVKTLPEDHQENLLKKVRGVTVEDIKQVLDTVVYDLFRPGKANVLVTCAPALEE
ncbi:uncharacterized protein A1O9_13105, partial [Exophiala aquamarina CBS 119918]